MISTSMTPRTRKPVARRVRVPNVPRVAKRDGHLVVRHAGQEYVLVPLEEIERREDEQDLKAAKRALARIKRGLSQPVPYEEARRKLGLA